MIKVLDTDLSSFELYTIFKDYDHSFILDSAMDADKLGRYTFISANPFKIIKYKNLNEDPFDKFQEELNKYRTENKTHLPFTGGAVGFLSYDLCHYVEKLPRRALDDTNVPDLYFGLYDWVIVVDHLENKKYIATPDLDEELENEKINNALLEIKNAQINGIDEVCYREDEFAKVSIKSNFSKSDYIDTIEKVREYIRSGDIYQANLTQRFSGRVSMSSYELYRDLRRFSPAPFGAFLNFSDVHILSNSPERF